MSKLDVKDKCCFPGNMFVFNEIKLYFERHGKQIKTHKIVSHVMFGHFDKGGAMNLNGY